MRRGILPDKWPDAVVPKMKSHSARLMTSTATVALTNSCRLNAYGLGSAALRVRTRWPRAHNCACGSLRCHNRRLCASVPRGSTDRDSTMAASSDPKGACTVAREFGAGCPAVAADRRRWLSHVPPVACTYQHTSTDPASPFTNALCMLRVCTCY